MLTKEDPQLGCECIAFNAQILLSPKTRSQLANLQDRILAQVKSPLWRCPSETLHVSITPFLSVRSAYAGRKEQLWRQNREYWTQILKQSVREIQNWTIRYKKVRMTEAAIFAVAEDGSVTNLIRHQLNLPESKGWNLVHTTLFRFASSYEMPASDEEKIRAEHLNIEEKVSEIVIAKEKVYPSMDSAVLERIGIKS